MEDLDNMRDYAWDDAILEALMSTIERSNSNPNKVSGCSLALQVCINYEMVYFISYSCVFLMLISQKFILVVVLVVQAHENNRASNR